MNQSDKSWRCNVCGYIHLGENPPEYCPVCGASSAEFSLYEEPEVKQEQTPVNQWRCIICNYIEEGVAAPADCPLCGAESDQFEPYREAAPATVESGRERIVIIGAGIAGVSAAETARKNSADSPITLISSELHLPYYRLNLTRYLAGEITIDELDIHPAEWYAENRIELLTGVTAELILPAGRKVELDNGEMLSYDRLILAAGAHAFIPPITGSNLAGVHVLRTLNDTNRIIEQSAEGGCCVCIGGGILGLETAGALAKRGLDVILLESHEWLMPRQLNQAAAEHMETHLSTLDIKLRKSAVTSEITGKKGRVSGVKLETGEEIPCDMVILCTGVRPNTYLARTSGLEVDCGIVVDNHLRTSDPAIFAAGDIAEHNGIVYGLWGPAQYQGTISALNSLDANNLFGGVPRSNTIKVLGLEMLSIGEFTAKDGSYRAFEEQDGRNFQHFVFHDNHLTGAILLGNIEASAKIKKAIEEKKDFSKLLASPPDCSDIVDAL